jgi:hypothetical protein
VSPERLEPLPLPPSLPLLLLHATTLEAKQKSKRTDERMG